MKSLSKTQAAYIAGFLDGDGSIYVQLKANPTYKFGFQVAPNIVFFQSQKSISILKKLKQMVGGGYIRLRKDGIAEYTIGDSETMQGLLAQIKPYLLLKKVQADLLVQILDSKKKIQNEKDFLRIAKLIDKYQALNYSKKRTIGFTAVLNAFKQKDV